ncbi:MAG: hypothetical protein ACYCV7_16995, partial [Acidimicrobiales bacterium]
PVTVVHALRTRSRYGWYTFARGSPLRQLAWASETTVAGALDATGPDAVGGEAAGQDGPVPAACLAAVPVSLPAG